MKLSKAVEIEAKCDGGSGDCEGCPLIKVITLIDWNEMIELKGTVCSFIQRLVDVCEEEIKE